jgi:hypothetical protein
MLFVVIREIESARREAAVFNSQREARDVYDETTRVCEDGPDDGPEDDPAVVTNCWLCQVDTPDPNIAKRSALSGHATLLAAHYR